MQGRRVQKVGPSTLAISLPSNWIKETGVRKGDLIFFTPESDGSLKLRVKAMSEREKKAKEFEIKADLCDQAGLLERNIVGSYLLGHDIIRIVSSKNLSTEYKEVIRGITYKLIGLGIIEETPMQIVLQCSIDPLKFPIDMVVRRLYEIASSMHRESIQGLLESKIELAKEAIRREDDADMMYWLATRLIYSAQVSKEITEKVGLENLNLLNVISIIGFLERMADWSEKIGNNVIEIKNRGVGVGKQLINEIRQLSKEAFDIHSKAMESIFTGDMKLANTAVEGYKNFIEKKEEELVETLSTHLSNSSSAANLRHILWGIRRIAELGAEIAELSIDQALEKQMKI
ncbi:MAG: phosphate uptake regulator PhoU [Candidatus Bathyarchaeota archaeon]|nr:phosphate uptake regulator PhoU [Candidatus Bathyarchaeota archaeon]